MTLSVKSSWSWMLKETSRRKVWGRERGSEREGDRKLRRGAAVCSDVEKDNVEFAEDRTGRQRTSFTV